MSHELYLYNKHQKIVIAPSTRGTHIYIRVNIHESMYESRTLALQQTPPNHHCSQYAAVLIIHTFMYESHTVP